MAMLSKVGAFDGFDPKTVYQMIPVNGVRTGFKIVSAGEPVDIEIRPAGIARFNKKNFSPGVPSAGSGELVSIGAQTTFTFDLEDNPPATQPWRSVIAAANLSSRC